MKRQNVITVITVIGLLIYFLGAFLGVYWEHQYSVHPSYLLIAVCIVCGGGFIAVAPHLAKLRFRRPESIK